MTISHNANFTFYFSSSFFYGYEYFWHAKNVVAASELRNVN